MPTYQCVEHFIAIRPSDGGEFIDRATLSAFRRLDAAISYAKHYGHRHRTVVTVQNGPHSYDPEIYRYEYPGRRARHTQR